MVLSRKKDNKIFETEIKNKLLLVYLIKKTDEIGKLPGITKLQKLVYLTENKANINKIKTLDYEFIRWHYGPYSKNLYDDFDILMANQIIKEESFIKLDDVGYKIFDFSGEIYEKNNKVINIFDEVIEKFATFNTKEISDFVYEMKIQYHKNLKKIKDLPFGTTILKILKDKNFQYQFQIEKEDLITLEYYFDHDLYKTSMNTLKRATQEKAIPYEPLQS